MKIPPALIQKSYSPAVKLALLLEYPHDIYGCKNCGGIGFISMFLATNGPFDSPGGKDKFVSKWHNGKWWCAPSGSPDFGTVSETCPECRGQKIESPFVPMPEYVRVAMAELSVKLSRRNRMSI